MGLSFFTGKMASGARAARLGAASILMVTLIGGCVFAPAGKRGNVEDELDTERELTLRALDAADAASALPSLVNLADNAGRMDEVGLRIQTIMLIAKTLDAEAGLWDGEKAENIRAAARRQADKALREASDWQRFEPRNGEAALLELDAKILRARMDGAGGAELESLLRVGARVAVSHKDLPRAAAWRLALARIEGEKGLVGEARKWHALAGESMAGLNKKPGSDNDPVMDSLRLAYAESEADLAAYEGRNAQALKLYGEALDQARKLRRRGDLKRILVKQADMAERLGDHERADWFRRRARGVVKKSAKSPGERLLENATPSPKNAAGDNAKGTG